MAALILLLSLAVSGLVVFSDFFVSWINEKHGLGLNMAEARLSLAVSATMLYLYLGIFTLGLGLITSVQQKIWCHRFFFAPLCAFAVSITPFWLLQRGTCDHPAQGCQALEWDRYWQAVVSSIPQAIKLTAVPLVVLCVNTKRSSQQLDDPTEDDVAQKV